MEQNLLFEKIKIPTFTDPRGDLSALELEGLIDWPVRRVYYITNTKLSRGGHCVKGERKIYLMCQGSCNARFFDGEKWYQEKLSGPGEAIILKTDLWREFADFSDGSVMVSLCNIAYNKSDYITTIEDYTSYIKNTVQ